MFYGRKEQIEQLMRLLHKQVGSFVTCRGRRRVGKSTLIEKFAKDCGARFLKLEGVKPKAKYTNEQELKAFADQLSAQTGAESSVPSNWLNAFIRCNNILNYHYSLYPAYPTQGIHGMLGISCKF